MHDIGNNRGNIYSRRSVKYDPDTDKEFWDFTLDGYSTDLKAMVQYISEYSDSNTTQDIQKVSIVAHSVGTAQSFMAMSKYPNWFHDRVSILIALAPVSRSKE